MDAHISFANNILWYYEILKFLNCISINRNKETIINICIDIVFIKKKYVSMKEKPALNK